MMFEVSNAALDDCKRIADIHFASFDDNALLRAFYPTEESYAEIGTLIKQETLAEVQENEGEQKAILVVRELGISGPAVVGFAKWQLPGSMKDRDLYQTSLPIGTRLQIIAEHRAKLKAVRDRTIDPGTPCYRLTTIATDSNLQQQGAATSLIRWGIERARKEKVPVYLESTPNASHVYRKLGFIVVDKLSINLPSSIDGKSTVYEIFCMLLQCDNDTDGMDYWDSSLEISSLKLDYEAGIHPQMVVQAVYDRIDAYKVKQPHIWVYLQPIGEIMRNAKELLHRWPNPEERPPLWGVPFSVADNIEVAHILNANTYPSSPQIAVTTASAIQRCADAGALFVGKTVANQLVTGAVGRSRHYEPLQSSFSDAFVAGASNDGSAISVDEGLVSFSICRDTLGAARVLASFSGIVAFTPTISTVSAQGSTTLETCDDTITFMAMTTADVENVWMACKEINPVGRLADASAQRQSPRCMTVNDGSNFSFRFGIPPDIKLDRCSLLYRSRFSDVVCALISIGGTPEEIDWSAFPKDIRPHHQYSWNTANLTKIPDSRRYVVHKDASVPTGSRRTLKAVPATEYGVTAESQYLERPAHSVSARNDDDFPSAELGLLVLPTAPFHPTVAEVEKDPHSMYTRLITEYQDFGIGGGLTGISMPCGTYIEPDRHIRLPFGVTFWAKPGLDQELLRLMGLLEDMLRDLGVE